jgi:hypothetical protein
LWPIHPKPFPDELLSSWMVRIARTYGLAPASFWRLQAGRIQFHRVDHEAEDRLLQLISTRTGTPFDRVVATTLRVYRGCRMNRHGNHEVIRFCPACLEEAAYFRRRWRLEFFMVCDVHECSLHDHCANCRALVRTEHIPRSAESVAVCHHCGFDLRRAAAKPVASKAQAREVIRLETRLLQVLDAGGALQREESAGAIVGPGMKVKVASGGGDAGMSESGLHQVNGGAAVEGMGGVRVPEPVGRDGDLDASAPGRLAHDAEHGQGTQNAAVGSLAGAEDRITGAGIGIPGAVDEFPNGSGHLNGTRHSTLAENRDLATVLIRLQVSPAESA